MSRELAEVEWELIDEPGQASPEYGGEEESEGHRDKEEGSYQTPFVTPTSDTKLIILANTPDKSSYEVITGGVDIAPLHNSGYLYGVHLAIGWASRV